LIEVLQREGPLEQIPFDVLTAVEQFSGGHLIDDLAVLCVAR
jgi:hypothetical protein